MCIRDSNTAAISKKRVEWNLSHGWPHTPSDTGVPTEGGSGSESGSEGSGSDSSGANSEGGCGCRSEAETNGALGLGLAALQGDRVGVAFRHLFRWFEQVNTELTTLDEDTEDHALRRAQLCMLRQDLAGFMLLGDPAARLAVAAKPAAASKPASLQAHVSDFFGGMNVTPAAATEPGIDRIEQAIGQVLAGSQTPQRAAQGLGMTGNELAQLVETYRRGGRAALGRD